MRGLFCFTYKRSGPVKKSNKGRMKHVMVVWCDMISEGRVEGVKETSFLFQENLPLSRGVIRDGDTYGAPPLSFPSLVGPSRTPREIRERKRKGLAAAPGQIIQGRLPCVLVKPVDRGVPRLRGVFVRCAVRRGESEVDTIEGE